MTPLHQREKEILETIYEKEFSEDGRVFRLHLNPEKLASHLYKLESLLDDLYRILTPNQLIELGKDKEVPPFPNLNPDGWNRTTANLDETTAGFTRLTPNLDGTTAPTDSKRK